VKVVVPGSTANLGPGFDTLGLAVNLYTEVEVLDCRGSGENEFFLDVDVGRNLVAEAMETVCKKVGRAFEGISCRVHSDIPVSRGMGSSAAAIVSGIRTMNALLDFPLTLTEEIELAVGLEGHPDNVLPAFLGGLVSGILKGDGSLGYTRVEWHIDADILFVIPEIPFSTKRARAVLPDSYRRCDVVYNVQRVSSLVLSVVSGDVSLLKESMKDRIHQPYRLKLLPEVACLFDLLESRQEVYGVSLSGSGPSLFAVVERGKGQEVGQFAVSFLLDQGLPSSFYIADVDRYGAKLFP